VTENEAPVVPVESKKLRNCPALLDTETTTSKLLPGVPETLWNGLTLTVKTPVPEMVTENASRSELLSITPVRCADPATRETLVAEKIVSPWSSGR
jgi:hypothetical protein